MKVSAKKIYPNILLAVILLMAGFGAYAQTPQWDWANSAGGSNVDELLGSLGSATGTIHLDSAGNTYAFVVSQSSSITFGTYSFNNPGGTSGASIGYFLKYSPQGTVLWATQFPLFPAAAGGGAVIPISMFTDQRGYSFLIMSFRDSLRLGGILLVDTAIHISSGSNNGYCIAEYDPNGNVVALHAFQSRHSTFIDILQLNGDQILAAGSCNSADTLNGQPVDNGYFLAVMDSTGNVLKVCMIGYDSSGGAFLSPSGLAVSSRSVYLALTYINGAYVYPASLPLGNMGPYLDKHILIRFDSLLNFRWFRVCSQGIIENASIYADQQDNVYADIAGTATIPQDTLRYDTTAIVLPYIVPIGQSGYLGMIKIDSGGTLQWIDTMIYKNGGQAYGLCADRLGNAYLSGSYGSYLITGADTLSSPDNVFIAKVSGSGSLIWARSTQNGGDVKPEGLAEDGHGNIYMSGTFNTSTQPFFGRDSLVCHAPVSGVPLAPDIFTARLGTCAPAIPAITASGPLSWCGADSVILSAPQAHSYLWSDGDTTKAIAADSSGQYSVYAIDSMGCYAQSALTMVWAHPQPSMSASVAKEVSCFGDSTGQVSLSANGGTPPYTYSSQPPVSDYQAVGAGTYYINLSDSNGCMAKDTVTLTQPPSALSVQIDTIYDGAIAIPSGATPPYTLIWSDSLTGDTISGLSKGWYAVTVTDTNGCRATDSVFITGPNGIAAVLPLAIRVYPDPAAVMVYIENPGAGYMQVYDVSGNEVWQQWLTAGKNTLDVSAWPEGSYLMEISNEGAKGYENKLIVIH